MTESEAYARYDDMLNELYPLDGINCNSFSVLLCKGDSTAYECGFDEFCNAKGIEVED